MILAHWLAYSFTRASLLTRVPKLSPKKKDRALSVVPHLKCLLASAVQTSLSRIRPLISNESNSFSLGGSQITKMTRGNGGRDPNK